MKPLVYITVATLVFAACKSDTNGKKGNGTDTTTKTTPAQPVAAPAFSGDTALMFVQKQVDFGPRVPGTAAHAKCAQYLYSELKKYADNVILQQGQAVTADKTNITIKNIIGEFNPTATNRILLFAHWDTRPWADEDTKDQTKPILGANDGGSGVGVLLEVARQLSIKKPTWGVDIIFFDAEDWGKSEVENSYCLGSQYWGKNLHKAGYKANYGILLDMVGAPNATFLLEGYSKQTAPDVLRKVWDAAGGLNHYNHFLYTEYGGIIDDHYYVNRATGIPCIDIIHVKPSGGFGDFWHTHNDDMDVVNKNTLQAVGETLLHVVYNEK